MTLSKCRFSLCFVSLAGIRKVPEDFSLVATRWRPGKRKAPRETEAYQDQCRCPQGGRQAVPRLRYRTARLCSPGVSGRHEALAGGVPASSRRSRVDKVEQEALLAVCSFPAVNRDDRRAKANYLLDVEARGELDLPDHIQAILHSTI
ncbi:hypothetical protein FJ964_01240 [Mesorhizobium sp. B2-3-2]|nr:hypothetical protein FJ964_01240 [Mesorhizobium sp. B2-3-2]